MENPPVEADGGTPPLEAHSCPAGEVALPSTLSPAGARLRLLAGALLFSTGGAGLKQCLLSGLQVACFRSAIAALAVLCLMPAARQLGTRRTWLVGAVYAATMILFVQANKLTTAANTIFLQSTAPLHILLLSPWLLKEPVRRRDLAFLAALGVGLGLIFLGAQPPLITAPRPFLGNVLAAISGLGMALTIMGLRWVARGAEASAGSPASAVVSGNVIAFLVCLPWALPVSSSRIEDWLVLGYLGSFQIGLAYCLVTAGLRRVPALEASLLLMLEPVLNPIWVLLVHREKPSGWALAGGALILAATAVRTWRGIRSGT